MNDQILIDTSECSFQSLQADPIAWSFDDYLQFYNAFSHRSSLLAAWMNTELADLKIYWAFRIFDFNDDNAITQDDLVRAIALMVGERRIGRAEVEAVAANIIRARVFFLHTDSQKQPILYQIFFS